MELQVLCFDEDGPVLFGLEHHVANELLGAGYGFIVGHAQVGQVLQEPVLNELK